MPDSKAGVLLRLLAPMSDTVMTEFSFGPSKRALPSLHTHWTCRHRPADYRIPDSVQSADLKLRSIK